MSLQQLLDAAGVQSAAAALKLLQDGLLFTDLDRCRISVPAQCLVTTRAQSLSEHFAAMDAATSVGLDCTLMHSPEILTAYRRHQELDGHATATRSARTHRSWRKTLAQANGAWTSLAPRHASKGNRQPRISPAESDVLRNAISHHYLMPECPSYSAAYGQYLLDHEARCAERKLPATSRPVCYTTFRSHCHDVPAEDRERARSGRRAANAHAAPVAPEHRHLTPARVMERAHIDHYLCDIYVLIGHTDKPETRRPWLTAMRDEATGAILATSLSFKAPSHLSCLNVIRDCVRRHQRMPETLVVDNGAEFHSIYFESVLACLGVAKQCRPPGNPRSGGPIEGWFHSVKAFLATQKGNTTNDAKARSASESHKGRRRTHWSLDSLFAALEDFTFQHFNNSHSSQSLCPRAELVSRSLASFPNSGQMVAFDDQFLAQTAAPLKKKLKLDPARGVRHLDRWFSHPNLFTQRCNAKHLQAFVEPWDRNRLYVRFNCETLTCRHGSYGASNLVVDFSQALESILFLECQDLRTKQAELRLRKDARLARKWQNKSKSLSARAPAPDPATLPRAIQWPVDADQVAPYERRHRS